MNLDANFLPVTIDPDTGQADANDQLHRCAFVSSVVDLAPISYTCDIPGPIAGVINTCRSAITLKLMASPGIYTRYPGGPTNDVAGDQLVPVAANQVCFNQRSQAMALRDAIVKRWGFAQNTMDINGKKKLIPIADFVFFRMEPLFDRALTKSSYISDLYLLWLVVGDLFYRIFNRDPADINNTWLTLAVCKKIRPTFISRLAAWAWTYVRSDRMWWLRRYHRAEAGGNPWIADLCEPVDREVFG